MDRSSLMLAMLLRQFNSVCTRRKYRGLRSFCVIRAFHKVASQDPPTIPLSRLKQTFRQQYLAVTEGHACIIADCPICDCKEDKAKIYINKMTGSFVCNKCRYVGSSDILQKFLTMKNGNGAERKMLETIKSNLRVQEDYSEKWESMRRKCQDISSMPSEDYKAILDKLSLPSISQTDMQQLNCIYESLSNTLYFPVVGLGNTLVGYKSISTSPEMEKTVPPAEISGCVVYRERDAKSGGPGIVVETIHDLLALASKKAAHTILCLPYNLQHLPQEILPSLESFKKLILWFGNDETSWYMARHFAKKLGEKRCYFIRPTDVQPRPKLAADMCYDLKTIVKNAQAIWHESITTFHHLRQDVLSDLQNFDKVQGIKWKRYPSLNRILKGHRRGEFTVLTGSTGSGKTTFTSEYSLDLAMQGVNTLWGSFEIRNTRLARTMLQQMAGVSLADNIEHFDMYADAFEKLPIYFMTFHGQQSIKVVMEAVEHATYVHDIAHVIIDNVQFMMGTDESKHMDRFWRQDSIIGKFRNFATKYNCHVTMIIHPRKERDNEELTTSSIFGGAKATQEADNVLIIQDKRLSTLRGKKFLQIAKNRYSGDLGIMMLDFDSTSLSFAQKKKSKPESTEEEKARGKRGKEDS